RHAHYEYITLGLEDEASRDYVSDRLPAWINKGLRRPAVKILVLYDWALRFLNSSVLEGLRVLCPNADIQLLTNVSPSRRPVDQEVTLPGLWDWGTTHAHMINLAFSDIKENACHTADTA
ncbi:MAG: hypothetical protein KDB07_00350, partial [Planctomycetes bacterium]|nr:hypothetical protein [Planctomycetota bacterium]